MTDQLQMVLTQDVRDAWPMVRDRIAAIAELCAERWMPEDVFLQLMAGVAYLWHTAEFEGFLIVQVLTAPEGRHLHCWICSNATGEPLIAYWDQLLDIARENGCAAITFENDRKGFQRAVPGLRCRYAYHAPVS